MARILVPLDERVGDAATVPAADAIRAVQRI
jgi:hypothetical protein